MLRDDWKAPVAEVWLLSENKNSPESTAFHITEVNACNLRTTLLSRTAVAQPSCNSTGFILLELLVFGHIRVSHYQHWKVKTVGCASYNEMITSCQQVIISVNLTLNIGPSQRSESQPNVPIYLNSARDKNSQVFLKL